MRRWSRSMRSGCDEQSVPLWVGKTRSTIANSYRRCFRGRTLPTGIVAVCLAVGLCGIWSLLGSILIIWSQDTWSFESGLAVLILLFGVLCLVIANGLRRLRRWAPFSITMLSGMILATN